MYLIQAYSFFESPTVFPPTITAEESYIFVREMRWRDSNQTIDKTPET